MRRAITAGVLSALEYCHARGVVHVLVGTSSVLLSSFDDDQAKDLVVKLDGLGCARHVLCPRSMGWPGVGSRGRAGAGGQATEQAADQVAEQTSIQAGDGLRGVQTAGLDAWVARLEQRAIAAVAGRPDPVASDGFRHGAASDLAAAGMVLLDAAVAGLGAAEAEAGAREPALRCMVRHLVSGDVELLRSRWRTDTHWRGVVALLDERGQAGWHLLGELLRGDVTAGSLLRHPFLDDRGA